MWLPRSVRKPSSTASRPRRRRSRARPAPLSPLCPLEGPWDGVGLREETIDRGLKFNDRAEHAALETPFGEFGEKAFNGVQPRCRCGREVKAPPRMASQPRLDLRVLVGGVVVDDGVDRLVLWHGGLGGIEKADELLMAVALHAAADH